MAVARQARREDGLRPLGHPVLPLRVRPSRGQAVPLGGLGLRARRRHRVRARQDPRVPGGRRRRRQRRRCPHLPEPVGAHPGRAAQAPAAQGALDPGRAAASSRAARARCAASTATTRAPSRRWEAGPGTTAPRRRCSSWSATTPPPRRWSSTGSPAGSKPVDSDERDVIPQPGQARAVLERRGRPVRWPDRARSSSTPTSSTRGEGSRAEFKAAAATEIDELKADVASRFPGARAEAAHRRGDPPRGDEHRRQARAPRRRGPLRGVGLDAHRGLGRQHRHPHPRGAGLRHPAALRAGRRPRPPPPLLRRSTPTRGRSPPSTPRSTASPSPSSRPAASAPSRRRPNRSLGCGRHRPAPSWPSGSPSVVGYRHELDVDDRLSADFDETPGSTLSADRRADRGRGRAASSASAASMTSPICRASATQEVAFHIAQRLLDTHFGRRLRHRPALAVPPPRATRPGVDAAPTCLQLQRLRLRRPARPGPAPGRGRRQRI